MRILKKALTVKVIGLVLLIALVVTLIGAKDRRKLIQNTITVSATSTTYTQPDLGLITASVITEKKTVEAAMSENTEKMNAIILAVQEEGVEEKDLKTVSFNIYPKYEWRTATYLYPQGQRVLTGYEVSQSLQIKIRDLEKIGTVIQTVTDKGANQVSDLQLTVEDPEAIKDSINKEAIDKAKAKAERLAKDLGVKLKEIVGFSQEQMIPYTPRVESLMFSKEMGAVDEAALIELGENKIEVTVYITYRIK